MPADLNLKVSICYLREHLEHVRTKNRGPTNLYLQSYTLWHPSTPIHKSTKLSPLFIIITTTTTIILLLILVFTTQIIKKPSNNRNRAHFLATHPDSNFPMEESWDNWPLHPVKKNYI